MTKLADAVEKNEHLVGFSCLQNPCSFNASGVFNDELAINLRMLEALMSSPAPLRIGNNDDYFEVTRKLSSFREAHALPDAEADAVLVGWKMCIDEKLPLVDVPSVVLKQGPKAIERFFNVVRTGGLDPTRRLSVMVVGRQKVGKTSLIQSIEAGSKGRPVPEGPDTRTIGVERHLIGSLKNKDSPTELIVLDFAGQEDYYASHTLFHRSGGLVVLVFDLSAYSPETFEKDIYFFVHKMNASWPGFKFVLVGTKSDRLSAEEVKSRCQDALKRLKLFESDVLDAINMESRRGGLNQARREELAFIASNRPVLLKEDVFAISNVSRGKAYLGRGQERSASGLVRLVDDLHDICASSGQEMPMAYQEFRDQLRQWSGRSRCISLVEALRLSTSVRGLNEQEAVRQALQVLHDINDLLWFSKDARVQTLVFLDPAYVMDVIKPLVRHDLLTNKEDGPAAIDLFLAEDGALCRRTKETLRESGTIPLEVVRKYFPIWKEMSQDIFDTFISLMEIFQMGFVVGRDPERGLLMPFRVSQSTSGSEMDFPRGTALRLHRAWEFVHFFPSGIMSSIAVAFHAVHRNQGKFFLRKNVLISKVAFNDSVLDSRIIVETGERSSAVRLELKIHGNDIEEVRAEARAVSERIEQYLFGFPGTLVNRIAIDPADPKNEFDLDDVRKLASEGTKVVLSSDGNSSVSLEALLPDEFFSAHLVHQPSFRQGLPTLSPFVFEGSRYHFFLSHYQTEMGDFCGMFQLLLLLHGVQSWFDQRAEEISADSMRLGIVESDAYVLCLSKSVLTRRFVRFELVTAIELEKPIVVLLETRDNRAKFNFGDRAPLVVEGEDSLFQSRFSKRTFPEMVDSLLTAECIEIHRRDRHEAVMVEQVVEIATDEKELLRRKEVTRRIKAEMGW